MYRGIFRLDFIGMTDELFVSEGGNGRNGRQEIVERAANFRHASLVLCRVERNAGPISCWTAGFQLLMEDLTKMDRMRVVFENTGCFITRRARIRSEQSIRK